MSLAWAAYRAAARVAGALAPAARAFAPPAERALWSERLGRTGLTAPAAAWIHAASMGESTAVAPFAAELARRRNGAALALTAMTLGGRERLARLGLPASLAPIDAPQAVRRFLEGVRPGRLFLVETELWPEWLVAARDARLPVAVVSARLSERSVGRYQWLGPGFRALIATLSVCCQSARDRERWIAIGARESRVAVTGNLKWEGLPRPAADRAGARRDLSLDPVRPLLVLGSLRPGEAAVLVQALKTLPHEWQVVAVPRHPAASVELETEATRAGQPVVREGAAPPGAWRWDDRLGVLAGYFAVADAAFVGGSLVPLGGHNPFEPAATGAAVLMGPHFESQRDAVDLLAAADAIQIVNPGDPRAFGELLRDRATVAESGRRARAAVESQRGVACRTVDQLAAWSLWP